MEKIEIVEIRKEIKILNVLIGYWNGAIYLVEKNNLELKKIQEKIRCFENVRDSLIERLVESLERQTPVL